MEENIKTIFYFEPKKADYLSNFNNSNISSRTITFISDTGEIYKNGVRYGGLTNSEVNSIVDTKIDLNRFDPSGIESSITNLTSLIAGLNTRVSSLISDKENDIKGMVNDVLSEYVWLKKNLGDVFAYSGFINELNAYMTTIGNLTNDNLTNHPSWTSVILTINTITSKVAGLEANQLTENEIRQWIRDGVSGIDLSTYALKGDLSGFLTANDISEFLTENDLDSLFHSKLLADPTFEQFTTSFLSLSSDVDTAKVQLGALAEVIGQWSGSTIGTGQSITQYLTLLDQEVDTINHTVTTNLTNTIRDYLGSDLQNGIAEYIQQNQSGLLMRSDLDSAVAALFSLSSSTHYTQDAVDSVIANTAGLITETNLDSAMATLLAMSGSTIGANDMKVFYCEAEDTSATAASFTLASGQTISIGSYYSASQLATKCSPSTEANINAATAPFLIAGNSKKYRIVKVSATEGAMATSKLYAAILLGVKNDQSFIDMVAQNINIGNLDTSELRLNANQIILDGTTWADELHVDELITDSIKDSDGNSIQVNYLVDKVKLNSVYTAEVISLIPSDGNDYDFDYACNTEFVLSESNKPAVLISGRPADIRLECSSKYSLIGHIKVTMNGKNITNKYTTYDKDSGEVKNIVRINIPCVDGNVVVIVDGIEDGASETVNSNLVEYPTTFTRLSGIPRAYNMYGVSSSINYTGTLISNEKETYNNSTYPIEVSSWTLSSGAPSGVSIANGNQVNPGDPYNNPVLTIASNASTGSFTIEGTTAHAGTTISFPVVIVNDSNLPQGAAYLDFTVKQNNTECNKVNDYSDIYTVYMGGGSIFMDGPVGGYNGWGIEYSIHSDYNQYATITSGGDLTVYKPGLVPVRMTISFPGIGLGDYAVTRWILIKPKLFASPNSTCNVYADIYGNSDKDTQFVTNNHAINASSSIIQTKYISYDRDTYKDTYVVYLYEKEEAGKFLPTVTVDTTNSDNWITVENSGSLWEKNNRVYVTFTVGNYTDAISHYTGLSHAITIDDQHVARQGKLILNSSDGSTFTIYVTLSGNFGFYDILKDGVHGCISANCLAPKYHWKKLRWYSTSAGSLISSDFYPYSILTPSSKWACYASTSDGFGSTSDYTYIGDEKVENNLVIDITQDIE